VQTRDAKLLDINMPVNPRGQDHYRKTLHQELIRSGFLKGIPKSRIFVEQSGCWIHSVNGPMAEVKRL
jgi:hypothetical protein